MSQKIEEFDVKKEYGDLALSNKNDFINKYNINMAGLTASQVDENQKKYGANQISGAKPKRWYHYFFESLFSPFNAILLGISLSFNLYRYYFTCYPKSCKYNRYYLFSSY